MDRNRIAVYLTAESTENRITPQEDGVFQPDTGREQNIINVYDEITYQEFLGFGGAFTESAADTFYRLGPFDRKQMLDACFDRADGNGYSFCRTHMNSCDFSLENYACDDVPDDTALARFSIRRDLRQRIPMIREAMEYGSLKLFFSPWSPPAWMKSNGSMNNGGALLPQYRAVWAQYYVKFIQAYRENGIPFWGLTVQNEPKATQTWDSCVFTAQEEAEFVRDYLGPALRENGLADVRIMIWDHNKERLVDRVRGAFSDPGVSRWIWGAGFHWYSGDHFEELEAVHHQWPDKHLVFTEGCVEKGPDQGNWDTGERYGHEIIGDLNHYACAWCDWNLLLNIQGGPNHVENYCDAPIIADTERDRLIYETSYWYIGHFSRFIKPGSFRICSTKFTDRLECTAFKNPDGTIALVVMNRTDREQDFALRWREKLCDFQMPAHSIMTAVFAA